MQHFAQIARAARYAAMQPDAVARRAIAPMLYHNPDSTFGMSDQANWHRCHGDDDGRPGFWFVTPAGWKPGDLFLCAYAVQDDFGNLVQVRQ